MYRFLPLVFLPLTVLAADEPPKDGIYNRLTGGLYDTCNVTVAQDTKGEKAWVTGKCRKRDGSQMAFHLDLDRCFTWTTWHMEPEKDGTGFSARCRQCGFHPELNSLRQWERNLKCLCGEEDYLLFYPFQLNRIISNDGGYLSCFGLKGHELMAQPMTLD